MMLQSVDFLPIVYNIGMLVIFTLWLTRHKNLLEEFIRSGPIWILWLVFVFTFITALIASLTFFGSDVDDAIISGTKAFLNGVNPYNTNVTVHFDREGTKTLGLYHYFPSDLVVHSLIYLTFGFLDNISPIFVNSWFFLGNMLFISLGYGITRKIMDKPVSDLRLVPVYGIITSFFLFSNSSLALLYFLIGFALINKSIKRKEFLLFDLGIIGYTLSAGVKYVAGLLIIIHLLEDLREIKKEQFLLIFRRYFLASLIFLITIIPFGVFDVLNATFLYQGNLSNRSEVAGIYGPILIELVLIFNLQNMYTVLFLFFSVVSIIIAFWIGRTTYEKQMILSFLFLFILPFYGTEFLIIPIMLWFFSTFGIELNATASSDHLGYENSKK